MFLQPRSEPTSTSMSPGRKSIKRNPDGRLKRRKKWKKLYGNKGNKLAGKVKWKSRFPYYLLTIHYWTRYTRFRIPIAKKFSTPYTLPAPILSQTNRQPAVRPRYDLTLPSQRAIRTRTYTNSRNKPACQREGPLRSRVCLENKNASSKLVYPARNVPTACSPPSFPSPFPSLSPLTNHRRIQGAFRRSQYVPAYFSFRIRKVPQPDAVFPFVPCYFLDNILAIVSE